MATAPGVARAQSVPVRGTEDLPRARVLDREGAKAYAEGRYNDAVRYFEEAYRLGGPPFELWNLAKCYLRLDQPEHAAELLERYLATPNLASDDREEATQQLDTLRKRSSTLTVASSPPGAQVSIDGKIVDGMQTPLSMSVTPGTHTVVVTLAGRPPYTTQIDARYGRAIILDAPLSRTATASSSTVKPPPPNPYDSIEDDASAKRPFAMRAIAAAMLPRYGSVGGSGRAEGLLSATYRVSSSGVLSLAFGGLLSFTSDKWSNTIDAPTSADPCGELGSSTSATAISAFLLGDVGIRLFSRGALHFQGGGGIATYSADRLGGDLFVPTCKASPGARPAMYLGTQFDFTVTPAFRVTVLPIALQVQPAFDGVRSQPIDTSGIWLRASLGVGVGLDL